MKCEVVADDGRVVYILNAQTIRNPHTVKHKLLANLIDQHDKVEFIGTPFANAERRTLVECVIVVLNKPVSTTRADLAAAGMHFDIKVNEEQFSASPLASANIVESLVHSFRSLRITK